MKLGDVREEVLNLLGHNLPQKSLPPLSVEPDVIKIDKKLRCAKIFGKRVCR